MPYVAALVVGLVLLVLGVQGGIRLLLNANDAGVLGALPGGFIAQLVAYVALTIVGALLARWGQKRAKETGSLGQG